MIIELDDTLTKGFGKVESIVDATVNIIDIVAQLRVHELGIDPNVSVLESKCCSPVPGDEIVGFVTRGRGITIHRTDCINVLNLPEIERSRLIDAEWQGVEEDNSAATYSTEISIFANNRIGMFVDISKIFTEREIDIKAMSSRVNKQGKATITMSFDIHGIEELNNLMAKLRQIDGVLDIERTTG